MPSSMSRMRSVLIGLVLVPLLAACPPPSPPPPPPTPARTTPAAQQPGATVDQHEVVLSFEYALGRDPTPDEMRLVMNDPRATTRLGLGDIHRAALSQNPDLRREVVQRAFVRVFGHPVLDTQTDAFNGWLQNEEVNVTLYSDLLTDLSKAFVHQAYTRIFASFPPGSYSESGSVYDTVVRAVHAGTMAGEAIWTYVALSNPVHGSARTSYNGDRSNCIGGIGPDCAGAQMSGISFRSGPQTTSPFTTLDGRPMVYIQLPVDVGAILHDAACANKAGVWCSADNQPLFTDASQPAGLEWSKAVWDTLQNRMWFHIFGPYPADATLRADYSNDLRLVQNRPAGLPNPGTGLFRIGNSGDDMPIAASHGENMASTILPAPSGTPIDITDAAYCTSGQFRQEHDYLVSKWGDCA